MIVPVPVLADNLETVSVNFLGTTVNETVVPAEAPVADALRATVPGEPPVTVSVATPLEAASVPSPSTEPVPESCANVTSSDAVPTGLQRPGKAFADVGLPDHVGIEDLHEGLDVAPCAGGDEPLRHPVRIEMVKCIPQSLATSSR